MNLISKYSTAKFDEFRFYVGNFDVIKSEGIYFVEKKNCNRTK